MVLARFLGTLAPDIGVDLGTTHTHVCVAGKGIVLSEPSVVAVKKGTKQVLLGGNAVGRAAREMIGRTPLSIDAVQPLRHGVIADFEMTEAMLGYFLRRVHEGPRWFSPRVVIAVPAGINAVEKRAVFNAAERAGARKVYLIEEARAAGLGAGIPIHEARAHMIVDIGGGTTDIAILSLADVVVCTTLRTGGDAMDEAIVHHVKSNYSILLGSTTAEDVKIQVGSAIPVGDDASFAVNGRDLIAGLPRAVLLASDEIREALQDPVHEIVDAIRATLEKTGPELSGDLVENGMTLCGGGVLLRGLPELIQQETGLPVRIADDPMLAVARGTAVFLERLDDFKHILESADDEL